MDDDDVGIASQTAKPIYFNGNENELDGLPNRADLLRKLVPDKLIKEIEQDIHDYKPLLFMPIDVVESNENQYIGNKSTKIYKLNLYGILETGQKVHVILDGIEVYFDVRVPTGSTPEDNAKSIKKLMMVGNADYILVEHIKRKPFKGFCKEPVDWNRIYFHSLYERNNALNILIDKFETASNDGKTRDYFRLVTRNFQIPLTDWTYISDYDTYNGGMHPDGMHKERYQPKSPGVEYIFRINVKNIKAVVNSMDTQSNQELQQQNAKQIDKDRTVVMGWDTETYNDNGSRDVPKPDLPESHLFVISMTFHFKDDPKPFYTVSITDVETAVDDRWKTIVCLDNIANRVDTSRESIRVREINMLKAFSLIIKMMQPDIITGFNCMGYDWPFIINKSIEYEIIGEVVNNISTTPFYKIDNVGSARNNVCTEKVKISAGNEETCRFIKTPGYVPIDSMIIFKKLMPKASSKKLKFFLDVCGINPKADMPYDRMDNIYKTRDIAGMREVIHYCIIDSMRCPQLLIKKNIIGDKRELSALAFTSFYDAIFRADGHKIRNMAGAYANMKNLLINLIGESDTNSAKYEGAFVFQPKKGTYPNVEDPTFIAMEAMRLEIDELNKIRNINAILPSDIQEKVDKIIKSIKFGRPVTGLDYSSLYPSIIMTYNLSPDMFIELEEDANKLEDEGYKIHHSQIDFAGKVVHGWFVRHNNDESKYGLLVEILVRLFNKRVILKHEMHYYGKLIENMEIVYGNAEKNKISLIDSVYAELAEQENALAKLDSVKHKYMITDIKNNITYLQQCKTNEEFELTYQTTRRMHINIDSKQKALKVYMNTFYGEIGNKTSALYLLQLAAGVTSMGQYNLKYVSEYVLDKKFNIIYGDTDSLYVECNNDKFKDSDYKYIMNQIDYETYLTEMVQITMDELSLLKKDVNLYLEQDNGTKFLNMAYEEVLCPVSFVGKKKYYGIAHENVINFRPKKLFIKGIESIKQGNSKFLVKFSDEAMWRLMRFTNRVGMKTIIEESLKVQVETCRQKDISEYIKSAVWKPDKQNKSVQNFVKRMKVKMAIEDLYNNKLIEDGKLPNERLYRIPDVYERFNFVVTANDKEFDMQGKVIKMGVSDNMEYDTVVRAKNLPIDYSYYLEKQLCTPAARFISYYSDFIPKGISTARGSIQQTAEQLKKLEEIEVNNAKKYLLNYIRQLQGYDKAGRQQRGLAYKRVWKTVSQECYNALSTKLGKSVDMLNGEYVDWTVFMDETANYDAVLESYMGCVDIYINTYVANNKPILADYFNNLLKQYGLTDKGDPIMETSLTCKMDIYKLHQKYKLNKKCMGIYYKLNLRYDRQLKLLKKDVYKLLPELDIIANKYNYSLELLVEKGRTSEYSCNIEIINFITYEDELTLNKLHGLWNQITILRKLQYINIYVDRAIEQLKNKRLKHQPIIEKADIYENIYNDSTKLEISSIKSNEFAL